MPDLPALPFGNPTPRRRSTRPGRRPTLQGPGSQVQAERLSTPFQRLTAAFEADRLAVADDPAALEPEQVLVLEIAGELDEFVRAVQRVPGLEFLAEELEDKVEADEFAAVDKDGRRHPYSRQLFLVASDHTAWQQLLRLWQQYQNGNQLPKGLAAFRHLFERLRELRAWDDRDRLERTGVLGAWELELAEVSNDELIPFEAELWLRGNDARRNATLAQLRSDIEAVGGEIIQTALLEEINYHGVLGKAPARLLRDAVSRHEVRWLSTRGIRFFHAVGQIAVPSVADTEPVSFSRDNSPLPPDRAPQVALLDGVPVANHSLLEDRIVVDDPEDWEATTPVARRIHGTSMASLIVHGDLGEQQAPLPTKLYTRPILSSAAPDWVSGPTEELPRDRLPVDLVHGAVARLYEGDEPAAPSVRMIVLAVGDAAQQFNRFVSPLARLLDWLSSRYRVLFFVSAGNHLAPLEIPAEVGFDDPQEIQHELLCALQNSASFRRLLSPAESINALTIGASHSDSSTLLAPDDRLDPIVTPDLPNVASSLGSGVGRAIKPDLLLPGGRQLVRVEPPSNGRRLVTIPPSARPPGVCVAAPGLQPGALDTTVHATGTSVATGLAGHHAGHLLNALSALRRLHDEGFPDEEFDVVLAKAALVHGAKWGTARPFVDQVQEELGQPRHRDAVARLVGYGAADPRKALACDDHRVTLLAAGWLGRDNAHAYQFPLPPSLSAQAQHRRITLTLAWLSPINPLHRSYRRAALKLEPSGFRDLLGDRADSAMHSSRRGTVQHEILEGTKAAPYAPDSALELTVSCRASAGALDEAVPYAVIATLEVPEGVELPIYEEVRQALRVPVAVRTAAR